MDNIGITYTVTGRYMEGQSLTGYHLVGSDGSQLREGRDRIIYLISKGLIDNMRTQSDGKGNLIIRGKGVNLNNLPVFDVAKQSFRNNSASQQVANTNVKPKKNSGINPMGQYTVIKRIMFKNTCLGYLVKDYSGKEVRIRRDKAIELALKQLLSNVTAQKCCNNGTQNIILRGKGCNLNSLPMLLVNEQGKIIDPSIDKTSLTFRAALIKRSGLIYDNTNGKKIPFEAGDFLICNVNGALDKKGRLEIEKNYDVDNISKSAVCDDYLDNTQNYSVEIFGNKPIQMKKEQILTWTIIKPKIA